MYLRKTNPLPELKKIMFVGIALTGIVLGSCHKDDPEKPKAAAVQFSTASQTLDQNETNTLQVNLSLSNPLEAAGTVVISIDNSSTLAEADFTTAPEATSGQIILEMAKGATEASFTVSAANSNVDNKTMVFKLSSATGGAMLGVSGLTTIITIKEAIAVVPSIAVSGSNLDDFGEIENGKVSGSKSFTVSGSSLSSDISVIPAPNFKVSLDNIMFSDSLGVGFNTANSGPAIIYVQFAPESGTDKDITGVITLSSSGADDKEVAVSGTEKGNAAGSLFFNENFDYGSTAGDLISVSTDWTDYSGTIVPIQYTTSGLSFTGYGDAHVGGAVVLENGPGPRQDMKRLITSQSSETVYTALLVKVYTAGANADAATAGGDFQIALTDKDGNYFNQLYMKDDGNKSLAIGVAKTNIGGDNQVYSSTAFKYNTTYLIVMKYDFSKGKTSLFVLDGNVPHTEPATPAATAATGSNPTSFDNIIIRQSDHKLVAVVDNIRVAKTWKDVLGL